MLRVVQIDDLPGHPRSPQDGENRGLQRGGESRTNTSCALKDRIRTGLVRTRVKAKSGAHATR